MNTELSNAESEFMKEIKKNSGLTIVLGVVVTLMGLLAMGSPFITGLSVAIAVGFLLIVGGVSQTFFAIKARSGIFSIIIGILAVLAGIFMVTNPDTALATLTMFLAIYLIVSGVGESIMAFQVKPASGWGWALFSGIMSVILGVMIWSQFPLSGAWAIGILVGIKLLFSGWSLIMFGVAARSVSKASA
jgi:uncharacterized membrane protein HdeD (DUF308 family)